MRSLIIAKCALITKFESPAETRLSLILIFKLRKCLCLPFILLILAAKICGDLLAFQFVCVCVRKFQLFV